MSTQLSTFQTFPGGKQGRKSPLNVSEKLLWPTCNGNISEVKNNRNIQGWISASLYPKGVLKGDSCIRSYHGCTNSSTSALAFVSSPFLWLSMMSRTTSYTHLSSNVGSTTAGLSCANCCKQVAASKLPSLLNIDSNTTGLRHSTNFRMRSSDSWNFAGIEVSHDGFL